MGGAGRAVGVVQGEDEGVGLPVVGLLGHLSDLQGPAKRP